MFLEVGGAEIEKLLVEVLTTQVGVAVGGFNFEDSLLDADDGDVQSATTEIEDHDALFCLRFSVETVGDGSSSWLVDDSEDVETGDRTSILCGLSLRIIEIGGHSDDSRLNSCSEEFFGDFLHFGQNHGSDLLGSEFLLLTLVLDCEGWLVVSTSFDCKWPQLNILLHLFIAELSSNKSFDIDDCVVWVSSNLILSLVTNKCIVVGECDT